MELLYANYQDKNINEFMSLICKQEMIEGCSNYLLQNNFSIKPKKFIMAFYISGYNKELDIDNLNIIYVLSSHVTKCFKNNTLNEEILNKFENSFVEWQRISQRNLLTELYIQYFDLKSSINRIENEKINVDEGTLSHIVNQLQIIKDRIKSNDGIEILTRLETENDPLITYKLYESVRNSFNYIGDDLTIISKKAFWDSFEDIHLHDTLIMLNELYKSIIKNEEIIKMVDNVLDADFIYQQIINTNDFNYNQLIYDIFELIKEIDSSVGRNEIDSWLNNWSEIYPYILDINSVMPYVLRDMVNKLEHIKYIKLLLTS